MAALHSHDQPNPRRCRQRSKVTDHGWRCQAAQKLDDSAAQERDVLAHGIATRWAHAMLLQEEEASQTADQTKEQADSEDDPADGVQPLDDLGRRWRAAEMAGIRRRRALKSSGQQRGTATAGPHVSVVDLTAAWALKSLHPVTSRQRFGHCAPTGYNESTLR